MAESPLKNSLVLPLGNPHQLDRDPGVVVSLDEAVLEVSLGIDTSQTYLYFLMVSCYYLVFFGCFMYLFISFLGLTY